VKLLFDCKGLAFRAYLDFDKLLRLADTADLEKLDDFTSIDVFERDEPKAGTVITAEQLKPFVRRELRVDRRKGFVRNISSRSGLEQFLWFLSRCTPVPYATPAENPNPAVAKLLAFPTQAPLSHLEVVHGKSFTALHRPIYPLETGSPVVPPDMLIEVKIDEGGLKAAGFLAGYEGIIFPAEYRGVSVRVRGRLDWRPRLPRRGVAPDRRVEGGPESGHRRSRRALGAGRSGHAEPGSGKLL
jgi:hypothetical protein